ncbi:uncharacterized protein G2W53_028418 [Senna tora]|uniref:Uncharacterized protein n=1 Tax=Senna tora TaxID=362788 RepID=A0A834T2A7_9FABA|nr:uncharacterized protein G2W53_028418 [Senna tora]
MVERGPRPPPEEAASETDDVASGSIGYFRGQNDMRISGLRAHEVMEDWFY